MNLAEQVRQVHELKKAYEVAQDKLRSEYWDCIDDDVASTLKYMVTKTKDYRSLFFRLIRRL